MRQKVGCVGIGQEGWAEKTCLAVNSLWVPGGTAD